MEKEINKRYNDLLERSFKTDLRLFLYQNFTSGHLTEANNLNAYRIFSPTSDLILAYTSIHHLAKSSDLIPGTEIVVGDYDSFLKNWLSLNQPLVKELKAIYANRFISREDFAVFYSQSPRQCFYCELTEDKIQILLSQQKLFSKRLFIRGRTLEIDRMDSLITYTKGNMVFCCYWCNNAKTDEFSPEEFAPIGKQIKNIWEQRLEKRS